MLQKVPAKANTFTGFLKRRYEFISMLQEKSATERVWLAESNSKLFVLKESPPLVFSNYSKTLTRIPEHSNIRRPYDSIPEAPIMVYEHLQSNLWNLPLAQQSMQNRKRILKAVLHGLAALHFGDIVHLDIKPDNILVDLSSRTDANAVERIQLIDLENAMYLPPGQCVKGAIVGNENWRSPEAYLCGELSKPTDVFSFGAVCIYVMLGKAIFAVDDDFRSHLQNDAMPLMIRLQRAVSYFGTYDSIAGLKHHLDKDELHTQVLELLWQDREADYHSYQHFTAWDVNDDDFKNLVLHLMDLDPKRRFTAQQALAHPWFQRIE